MGEKEQKPEKQPEEPEELREEDVTAADVVDGDLEEALPGDE